MLTMQQKHQFLRNMSKSTPQSCSINETLSNDIYFMQFYPCESYARSLKMLG